MEMLADDLAGLLDAIGIKSTHIYGTSLGGGIAQVFALSYPDRVRSLVLRSTFFGGAHAVMPDDEFTDIITAMSKTAAGSAAIRLQSGGSTLRGSTPAWPRWTG